MDMTQEARNLAAVEGYIKAWNANDLETMSGFCADDMIMWHGHIRHEFSKSDMFAYLKTVVDRSDIRFHDIVMQPTPTGAVVQVLSDVTVFGGDSATDVPICIVYRLRDGLIVRMDEYIDGSMVPKMEFGPSDHGEGPHA